MINGMNAPDTSPVDCKCVGNFDEHEVGGVKDVLVEDFECRIRTGLHQHPFQGDAGVDGDRFQHGHNSYFSHNS